MTKLRQALGVTALAVLASSAVNAQNSVNVGIMSEYIFRGVYVSGASAFAGIDIDTDSGFYLGAWGADIEQGLEYDFYLGYVGGTENVSWNIGWTGYFATDEAFDTAQEINLGVSAGFMDLQYSLGELDIDAGELSLNTSVDQTYSYLIATFAPEEGPYYLLGRADYKNINPEVTFGIPGSGADGMWFEIGKDFDLGNGLEIGIAALYSPDVALSEDDPTNRAIQLSRDCRSCEYALVAHITKNIGIRD